MSTRVMIDGQLHQPETARISVFDRGFLYGDSVFETIRTYHGVPFRLAEHLDRLARSADRVLIPLPCSSAVLKNEILDTLTAAANADCFIRVVVTRGQGELGLTPPEAEKPLRVIIVGPLEPPPPSAYTEGIRVVTYKTQRTTDSTEAAGAKVANYLVAVLAMRQARAAGALEALVVDGGGFVVEGSSSNVFVVSGGRLITPPEESGILAGITRACLLEVAASLGHPAELGRIPLSLLLSADEVLISSSIRELLPVVAVDGRAIADGRPGALTRTLLQAFRDRVHQEVSSQAPRQAGRMSSRNLRHTVALNLRRGPLALAERSVLPSGWWPNPAENALQS